MAIVVPPSSAPPLPSQVFDRFPLSHKWVGWDGSEWFLSDPSSGVRLLRGYRGVGMPTPQRYSTVRPGLAGSHRRGTRYPDREVVWPLAVYTPQANQNWWDYDAAFWRTMDPDQPGYWEVTTPGAWGAQGTTRRLRVAFSDGGDEGITVDPGILGWSVYSGIQMIAEDEPFWTGDLVQLQFDNNPAATAPFFPPTSTSGFVVQIAPASTITSGTINNLGDVSAYPIYRIDGPTTNVTLGLNGSNVQYIQPIAAGQYRIIDTRPGHQTILDQDGNDRISDMGPVVFAPVPPRTTGYPLSMTMAGTGLVTVSLTPLYWRAW